MTYKQLETSREIRLWIRDIFVPAGIICGAVFSNPTAREKIKAKYDKTKAYVVNKFVK